MRGRGCRAQVRWVPCFEGGEEEQGGSEGLLEALHAGKGKGKGKNNAVMLRGG